MTKGAADEQKSFRIHPSDHVLACLKYLKRKGTLGKQLPVIALVLLGERVMELERDGLIPKDVDNTGKT